jgi:hypothetical protein
MLVEFYPVHSDLFDQFCIFSDDKIDVFCFAVTEMKEPFHLMCQIGDELFHNFLVRFLMRKVLSGLVDNVFSNVISRRAFERASSFS